MKVFGIIAMIAVIGLVFSCGGGDEASPDDQIKVTVDNLPDVANDKYAVLALLSGTVTDPKVAAQALTTRKIVGNKVTSAMFYPEGHKDAGKAFAEKGNYRVLLVIYPDEFMVQEEMYTGRTTTADPAEKGATVKCGGDEFSPNLGDALAAYTPPAEPPKTFFGIYTGQGITAKITETINFTKTSFDIEDDEFPDDKDFLKFTITEWNTAEVPTKYAKDYNVAYKFTGKITDAKPKNTTGAGYLYGSKTAPGFKQEDIDNETSCHMFIYAKVSGTSFTFIRTTFTKDDNTTNASEKDAITSGTGTAGDLRVYTLKK
jgi:hypothetical protein